MIKNGTRKCLRYAGTTLLVNGSLWAWDESGQRSILLSGGDLLMLTGNARAYKIEVISVANANRHWLARYWLVENTSLVFDARMLEEAQDV